MAFTYTLIYFFKLINNIELFYSYYQNDVFMYKSNFLK